MLIRFTVENFLSFKDRQTFSMIAGRGGRNKAFHLIKKENRNDINLLKTGVIFGANASGKSNLIKAIHFGQQKVLRGTPIDTIITYQNFRLHEDFIHKSSRIEYEIKHKGTSYAYGFVFNKREIKEEWLYKINKKKETLIFERSNTNEFNLTPLLNLNPLKQEKQFLNFIAKSTPDNQLLITEIRNRKITDNVSNIDDLLNVIDWFQNALTIFYPNSKLGGIEFELQKNTQLTTIFKEFLSYFDTGISGISSYEIDFNELDIPASIKKEVRSNLLNEKSEKTIAWIEDPIKNINYIISKGDKDTLTAHKLMTQHNIIGKEHNLDHFEINEESDGTQRMIDLIPIIIDLFKDGNIFIIDEIDRSLHPNIVYDLLDLFLEKSIGINSQLIITSHSPPILTQKLLRKDEIWFVVKDEVGASSLYSLEDYDVRFDKKIRKDYLLGRYKAIPRLGNRNNLSALKNN